MVGPERSVYPVVGEAAQPRDHKDRISRRIARRQHIITDLNLRAGVVQHGLGLRKIFNRVRIGPEVEETGVLQVNPQDGQIVEKKRENEEKDTSDQVCGKSSRSAWPPEVVRLFGFHITWSTWAARRPGSV